ncbi:uncharacterized protein LOC142503041 [Ascaphus truei]|uniref:uncharacterized protein LOC142503041 n=1 Tax=Ascaphus truei TaxID=8439 RepID=UPI003F5A7729
MYLWLLNANGDPTVLDYVQSGVSCSYRDVMYFVLSKWRLQLFWGPHGLSLCSKWRFPPYQGSHVLFCKDFCILQACAALQLARKCGNCSNPTPFACSGLDYPIYQGEELSVFHGATGSEGPDALPLQTLVVVSARLPCLLLYERLGLCAEKPVSSTEADDIIEVSTITSTVPEYAVELSVPVTVAGAFHLIHAASVGATPQVSADASHIPDAAGICPATRGGELRILSTDPRWDQAQKAAELYLRRQQEKCRPAPPLMTASTTIATPPLGANMAAESPGRVSSREIQAAPVEKFNQSNGK